MQCFFNVLQRSTRNLLIRLYIQRFAHEGRPADSHITHNTHPSSLFFTKIDLARYSVVCCANPKCRKNLSYIFVRVTWKKEQRAQRREYNEYTRAKFGGWWLFVKVAWRYEAGPGMCKVRYSQTVFNVASSSSGILADDNELNEMRLLRIRAM